MRRVPNTAKKRKRRAAAGGEAVARDRRSSARSRVAIALDDVRAAETELVEVVTTLRQAIELASAQGAIRAGGYGSAEELLRAHFTEGSPLSSLATERWPACPSSPGTFRDFASLLDAMDDGHAQARKVATRARKRLRSLEHTGFQAAGYRTYEELLERQLGGLPWIARAVAAMDDADGGLGLGAPIGRALDLPAPAGREEPDDVAPTIPVRARAPRGRRLVVLATVCALAVGGAFGVVHHRGLHLTTPLDATQAAGAVDVPPSR
jgi:hypothetical protein